MVACLDRLYVVFQMNGSIVPGHVDLLSVFNLPCLFKMKEYSGKEWNTIFWSRTWLDLHTNGKGYLVAVVGLHIRIDLSAGDTLPY